MLLCDGDYDDYKMMLCTQAEFFRFAKMKMIRNPRCFDGAQIVLITRRQHFVFSCSHLRRLYLSHTK